MNGLNLATYPQLPKGWDHIDVLVVLLLAVSSVEADDLRLSLTYMNSTTSSCRPTVGVQCTTRATTRPTSSEQRRMFFSLISDDACLQTLRLSRIEYLSAHDNPFYLQVAPASPHSQGDGPTVPLIRHMYDFNDAKSPRVPNFNPPGSYQNQKPSFLKDLPLMNDTVVNYVDWQYKSRLQALRGVDEIVEDVVELLEKKGILETTYGSSKSIP